MCLLLNRGRQTGAIGMAQLSGTGNLLVRWVCCHISRCGLVAVIGSGLLWRGSV
jgi:hypothetical protein